MSFHDDYFAAAGLPLLFEQHGQEITCTPPDGEDAVTLTAIVGAETQQEQEGIDRRKRNRTRTITITTDPSSTFGGIATPTTGYTATIGGVVYEFEQVSTKGAGYAQVVLVREASLERSRKAFRRK